ncbi:S-adenosylmethionine:tRNA ribosyltransferase-isomerase [Desulfocucumis palustris]|uniref:S-adenosylmethionine:tRNA ribosyltransferase-isomerase n=1 Tax=Desulfocucumis palustris TaxID=1898651 RepID=A0A2L2XGK3_9FIRM|nr:tRNA preQ1(34) S-adenosylmethionine ribosyltransferase-isomerase QueA [Desulfocucumis palustris]GBF35325.1 S-adenosylmethionine:tRNA ribosyltransferase-isomerase [Desulfocucumis palustris]
MKTADFDYFLPEELIAQDPGLKRDESRLLVLRRDGSGMEHRKFNNIVEYLAPGDVLVINDTRVIPARLFARKAPTGAEIEVLLLRQLSPHSWETLVRPGKRVRPGTRLIFSQGLLEADVADVTDAGGRILDFKYQGDFNEVIEKIGRMPLPPYIKNYPADPGRYQTVYAREPGSVAAPTAGLHFTPELLERIKGKGVNIVSVLLHVGLGTFRPVTAENVEEHLMHREYYEITPRAAEIINGARAGAGRVIAVGTTSTRCLESSAEQDGKVRPGTGWTDIFIYPGYKFKVIDGLITNFHLPCSTLLMLVSAFAGRERVLDAYRTAVDRRYRFFSFGDAMLLI